MVESFFGLQREPFSIAPDPAFLYLSDKHREALALLNLGLTRGASFVLLTGEIGAGKTTVWRRFLEELPSNFDVASVVNPKLDVDALLRRVCEDLQVALPPPGTPVDLIDALHGHLLLAHAQGRRTLIAIDEAQALSLDVLEQLRLLTNLDSSGKKLQVLLIGQPELRQILQRPELEPLVQRVVARYHLPALSESETAGYIAHRLAVAGLQGELPFDGESLGLVHRLCRGVPRRINTVCDRALAAAAEAGLRRVDRQLIEQAAIEVYGSAEPPAPQPLALPGVPPAPPEAGTPAWQAERAPSLADLAQRKPWLPWALAAGAVLVAGVWWTGQGGPGAPAPAEPGASVAPRSTAPTTSAAPTAAAPGATAAPAAAGPAADPDEAWARAFNPGQDEAAAWRALAALWGANLGPGDACSAAATAQLRCVRGRSSLAQLRQFDRPAWLRLVDAQGRVSPVLLLQLGPDTATLQLPGGAQTLPLAQLARFWRGDYGTLWRSPPAYREGDNPLANPELRAWVQQRLPLAPAPGAGDDALRAAVAAFQLQQGLTPDGVPGPLTLMQLARADGGAGAEPRLVLAR